LACNAHRSTLDPIGKTRTCPGCGTSRAIDLRTVDRHLLASVGTMVLGSRCSWCPGSAPMPRLLGFFALPPVGRQQVAL
jgi:hypothetical protein